VTIRVLIADDERLVRAGFRMILAAEPGIEVVGEARDGREAIEAVGRLHPDVVLMDVRMPGIDGLAATRAIVAGSDGSDHVGRAGAAGPVRVIVLTTFDLDEYVYGALQAGATGFLLKDAPEAQLVAAIRAAATGAALFSPEATQRLVTTFAQRRPARNESTTEDLTAREREVLLLVATGLSNREIAETLSITEHTAKTHVAHILGKLGLRDRVQAVVFAYEHDLVPRP
jgi:DNA-binding NarL/FixJ family response regulator